MKTCIHCNETKDAAEFGKDRRQKDGLSAICRSCMKLKNKANYDRHAEKRRESARLAASQNRNARSDYNRRYREQNREKLIEHSRAWRAAGNKANRSTESVDRSKARMKLRYATDPAYRERIQLAVAVYRKKNPIKVRNANKRWRAQNIDRVRKYGRERMWNFYQTPEGKAWMKDKRIKFRDKRQARRAAYYALRYGASGSISNDQLNWLHKWQDHCCCYCNAPLNGKETIEHVVPLSRGGENNPHNVLLACADCNYSKQDRLFDESEWQPSSLRLHPTTRMHSAHSMSVAKRLLSDASIDVEVMPNYLVLPNGYPLFILSTFWISDRSYPLTSVAHIRTEHPMGILTFDYEWLHHPRALVNVVRAKCGQATSVGARELDVESPTMAEAREFMGTWHAQGFAGGFRYLGLRHPTTREWHGMASFREFGTDYELARMAFKDHVSGGLSRLVRTFQRTLPDVTDLWTYADARFGEGLGYLNAGFDPAGETNGWYGYANGTGLHSRQAYRKTRMAVELDFFNPDWTERRLAKANGLWRVDGLPQKRFVLRS